MIRIAVVDDQNLVLRGVSELLQHEPDFEVVGQYLSGHTFLRQVENVKPDVVVLDVRMPQISGIETLCELRKSEFLIAVLMLTTFEDEEAFLQATAEGAQGFMLKDSRPEDLYDAIRTLHKGGKRFDPIAIPRVQFENHPTCATKEALSARELDVLRLVAAGYSNREIAKALFLAEGTIKNYVSEILSKLEVRDRTRAVLKAITNGLV